MSKQDCCCYNSGIVCGNVKNRAAEEPEAADKTLCMRCSWNPEVGKLRTQMAQRRLGLPPKSAEAKEKKGDVVKLPVCYYCSKKLDGLYEVLGETPSMGGAKVVCAFCGIRRYGADFRLRERYAED